MFCKNCGKQLADDAKFCANCGTPAAPPAPQEPSTASDDPIKFPGAGFPGDDAPISAPPISEPSVSEGAPVEEPSASEAESPLSQENAPAADPAVPVSAPTSTLACPLPADGSGADSSPVKRRGKAGLVVLGVGAVVVIAVVVLLVNVLGGLFSGGGKAMYAYRNDDGELMYLPDLKEKTTALELTDEADFSANVRFSPDGKSVYFTDADHTLYGITLSALKKGDKPERISRNVGSFFLLKDGRLLYTEYDSSESRLSLYEKGESFRLLKGYSDYQFSEDQKTIYYTERDETDDTLTLRRLPGELSFKTSPLGATVSLSGYDKKLIPICLSATVQESTRTVYKLKNLKIENHAENRETFRLPFNAPVSLYRKEDDHYKNPESCKLVNISTGGCCVQSEYIHMEDEVLRIRVKLDDYAPQNFLGQIVRCSEHAPGQFWYGILFAQLTEQETAALNKTLYNLQMGIKDTLMRDETGYWRR